MKHIRSRKHTRFFHAHLLGQSIAAAAGAVAMPVMVHAQEAEVAPAEVVAPAEAPVLKEVRVEATAETPYKAVRVSSPKATQPLVETPKTVQVIKKEILQEQGARSLMEALRNTPGITMQLGENGNTSAGDTFQMRGFSTQTSTFVDGIRDMGAVTRDVFNLEQVEVVKGPAGSDIGRGAAAGYINLVSKLPSLEDAGSVSLNVNTAANIRTSADFNRKLGDTSAVRLNVMQQGGGVEARDEVETNAYAVAPSFATGLGTETRMYLFSQHVRQENVPDGGVPTIGMPGFHRVTATTGTNQATAPQAAAINAAGRVDRENFYGSTSDYEDVVADMVTGKIEHDFSDTVRLTSVLRYGRSSMDRVLTGIASAINGSNVDNAGAGILINDPSTWTLGRSRQRVDQTNEILANQTSLGLQFDTGSIKHDLVVGFEALQERQKNLSAGTAAVTINGVAYPAVAIPPANLYNPDPGQVLGVPYWNGAYTDGTTDTVSLYVFDTLELHKQIELTLGLRTDRYDVETETVALVGTAPNHTTALTTLNDQDTLNSWNLGVLFKMTDSLNVYMATATSFTPPGGANFVLTASTTNNAANNSAMDPQKTSNLEFGVKTDLLNKQLSLTAAVYRTENDKQVSYDTLGNPLQFGETRVEGVELAAVGQITNFWQVSAGVATMKTTQSNQWNSTHTTETTGVRWSPELTATLWSSYTLDALTVGGGARYVSEQKRSITNTTTMENMPQIPDYVVADAMAAYRVSKNVNVRLNVYNIFDKSYISTLNNSGARMVMGDPLSASLGVEVQF